MKKLGILATLLCICALSYGQNPPKKRPSNYKPPKAQDIEKKVEKAFDKLPSDTASYEGIKLSYKKIPFNFEKMAEDFANSSGYKLPPSTLKGMIRNYAPIIDRKASKYMLDIGTFETEKPLKIGSKKVLAETYKFGIIAQKRILYRLVIHRVEEVKGKKKKRVFYITFSKKKRERKPVETLNIKLLQKKDKPGEFCFFVAYGYILYQSQYLKITEEKKKESK